MSRTVAKLCCLALLLVSAKASLVAADQIIQVPLEFATGRNALLLHVRINDKPALLILDTSSPDTVLQPELLGIKAADLTQKRRVLSQSNSPSSVINREVELQVGSSIWKKWRVKVKDQSESLSAYIDSPDGVLGLDFLREFSNVALDLERKMLTLTILPDRTKRPSFGNIGRLDFAVQNGHYILNETELEPVLSDSIEFATPDRSFVVRVGILQTVLISKGESLDSQNQELLKRWSETIPLVSEILKQQDARGSLKPLSYTLVTPKNQNDVQLREQLTLLWSSDPVDQTEVGHTGFGPPMRFSEQLIDVQYRDISVPTDHLISKVILQILYLQHRQRWMTIGAFVIASKSSGDYEFYAVPRGLLDRIVIRSK